MPPVTHHQYHPPPVTRHRHGTTAAVITERHRVKLDVTGRHWTLVSDITRQRVTSDVSG